MFYLKVQAATAQHLSGAPCYAIDVKRNREVETRRTIIIELQRIS